MKEKDRGDINVILTCIHDLSKIATVSSHFVIKAFHVQHSVCNIIITIVSRASAHPWVSAHACISFQGVNIAASIQTYIPGKCPYGPKSQGMFKCPWMLTWDVTVMMIESDLNYTIMLMLVLDTQYYVLFMY